MLQHFRSAWPGFPIFGLSCHIFPATLMLSLNIHRTFHFAYWGLTWLQQPQPSPPSPPSPHTYQLLTPESIISAARLDLLLFTKSNLSHPQSIAVPRRLLLSHRAHISLRTIRRFGEFEAYLHSFPQFGGNTKQYFFFKPLLNWKKQRLCVFVFVSYSGSWHKAILKLDHQGRAPFCFYCISTYKHRHLDKSYTNGGCLFLFKPFRWKGLYYYRYYSVSWLRFPLSLTNFYGIISRNYL